jgi:hypothetical protein
VKFTSLKPGGRSWEKDLRIRNEILQNVKSASDLNALLLKVILRQGIDLTGDINPTELLKDTRRKTGDGVKKLFDDLAAPVKK